MGKTKAMTEESFLKTFAKGHGNAIIFLFIWVLAMLFVDNFATFNNNLNIIRQAAIPMIACIGMTFVLITGGIDLSLGFVFGLCSYIFGVLAVMWEWPLLLAFATMLVIGGLCGLLNGVLVCAFKIPPFIVTLGTGFVFFGFAQIISGGSAQHHLPAHVLALGRREFFGLPASVYFAIAVIIVFYIILHRGTFGRALAFLGCNVGASRLSGINTNRITIMAYVICSALTALAAMLMTARVNSASPILGGSSFTFETITAAILGGASLRGGIGSVPGSVLGVLTIVTIGNCINLLGISFFVYEAALGIVILFALIFEKVKNRVLQ